MAVLTAAGRVLDHGRPASQLGGARLVRSRTMASAFVAAGRHVAEFGAAVAEHRSPPPISTGEKGATICRRIGRSGLSRECEGGKPPTGGRFRGRPPGACQTIE